LLLRTDNTFRVIWIDRQPHEWMTVFGQDTVHLSRVAAKIPGRAVLNSTIQRLRRFLDNSAVRVREWYKPIARDLLLAQAQSGQGIRLLVDGSKVGFGVSSQ